MQYLMMRDHVQKLKRHRIYFGQDDGDEASIIEHDVGIGQDAMLAQGITPGTGCVIGAVVTGSGLFHAIVGGNPVPLIRFRFFEEITADLLESCWGTCKVSDFRRAASRRPGALPGVVEPGGGGIDIALPASRACARRVLRDRVSRSRRRQPNILKPSGSKPAERTGGGHSPGTGT